MAKKWPTYERMLAAMAEADTYWRENPSRYTGTGRLKRLCAPDAHKPYGNSTKCEKCGLVVRGDGANLPLAPGEH